MLIVLFVACASTEDTTPPDIALAPTGYSVLVEAGYLDCSGRLVAGTLTVRSNEDRDLTVHSEAASPPYVVDDPVWGTNYIVLSFDTVDETIVPYSSLEMDILAFWDCPLGEERSGQYHPFTLTFEVEGFPFELPANVSYYDPLQ